MANAEIDVKAVTDKMEEGNGCALLFDKAFQDLNRDFKAQMDVVSKVEAEAKSRDNNTLVFEKIDLVNKDPITKKLIDVLGVSVKKNDALIFTEVMVSDHKSKQPLNVQKGCKP